MSTINPQTIGRYQILERVGRGGMGVLFRGIDPVLDREVAIKLMLVDFSEDAEQMRPRFYREARAAAKLQHRNIVTIFEFAEEGNTPYIVMEFLRGTSLSDRISSPLPLTLDDKLDIVAQLCDALHYAHEQGIVHRDVKPANIFILTDRSVKLLDFGIAKLTSSTLTRTGDVLGSASYMSPEQVSGSDSVDGRSDIFSAGVLLYELLAGRKPFQAEVPTAIILKILNEDPPPLDSLVPGLPAQLVATVKRALAKNPADRFSTANDFAKELQWIRKVLQASGDSAAAFDETRFATPAEIAEFQKAAEGSPSGISRPATGVTPSASPAVAAAGRKWLLPAAIAAVVLVAIGIGAPMLLRNTPSDAAPAPAATAAAPTAGAATAKQPDTAPAAVQQTVLQVSSTPAGAAIMLDGRDMKLVTPTPVTISGPGPHTLALSKAGFLGQEVRLEESDLQRGSATYTLEAAPIVVVPVTITSTYPVEVLDGGRALEAAAESHNLKVPAGKTLTVRAPEYLLQTSIKVTGKPIAYQAPSLGYLTVLSKYETCSVKIGAKDLGFPPITRLPIAAGEYRIDTSCAGGQSPPSQVVNVTPNNTVTARIF